MASKYECECTLVVCNHQPDCPREATCEIRTIDEEDWHGFYCEECADQMAEHGDCPCQIRELRV